MIQGITIFAEGLFEATVLRATKEEISIPVAFSVELQELHAYLEELESRKIRLKQNSRLG
jgi:hypothetical protein